MAALVAGLGVLFILVGLGFLGVLSKMKRLTPALALAEVPVTATVPAAEPPPPPPPPPPTEE